MFRECYFEYAGLSSEPYNLMLCYVSNSNTDFDSGGKFDLKTDTLPRSHETLLYGKDYSAQPLEFDVEFLNMDGNIPLEQMIEIKNWLFEQDGWKSFKCLDERQDRRLKCIFEPGEDIVDGTGYRGVRCKLKNASPFWYGDPITVSNIELDESKITIIEPGTIVQPDGMSNRRWQKVIITLPDNCADSKIFPDLTLTIDMSERPSEVWYYAIYQDDWSSGIEYSNEYLVKSSIKEDELTVQTKYGIVYSHNTKSYLNIIPNYPVPLLRLHPGENTILIHNPTNIYIRTNFTCTPMFRMGAF